MTEVPWSWNWCRLLSRRGSGHIADLAGRGLVPGAIETVNKGVQLSAIIDPDGNTITFIGNFRIKY